MRTSLDKLSFHLMNATADDWESLDQILPEVEQSVGVSDRLEVAKLIVDLVADGLLEEMKHKTLEPEMIARNPSEYWFAMTAKGRVLWDAEAQKYEQSEA